MARDRSAVTRRLFVQATAAGSLALAGAGFARVGRAQTARPNIVFIMADDLGFADVSAYGQRDYTTPNIDRLAIEGLKFNQAYSNSANCSPTRTALATGRYQQRLEVGLEEPINDSTPPNVGLPPSHPTLPSLLRKAGYATTLVGKWHLGSLPNHSPLKSGYDHFFGIWGGSADYFDHGPKSSNPLYEEEVPVERHGYMTNLLGDRAVQTVEGYAKSRQPFLLSLHFTAPHWPWEGPDDRAESKRIAGRLRRCREIAHAPGVDQVGAVEQHHLFHAPARRRQSGDDPRIKAEFGKFAVEPLNDRPLVRHARNIVDEIESRAPRVEDVFTHQPSAPPSRIVTPPSGVFPARSLPRANRRSGAAFPHPEFAPARARSAFPRSCSAPPSRH